VSRKITVGEAVGEAQRAVWARKWSILLLLVLSTALTAPISWADESIKLTLSFSFTIDETTFSDPVGVLLSLLRIAGQVVLATFYCRLIISYMRGEGRIIPENLIKTNWRVFVKGLIVFALCFFGMLLVVAPLWLYGIITSPEGTMMLQYDNVDFALLFVFSAFGVFHYLLVRLGVMVPGAADLEPMSVKEAWVYTKGHSLRMLGSSVLILLIYIGITLILFASMMRMEGELSVWYFVFPTFIGICSYGLMLALFPVWYEKLRLYHMNESETEEEPAPESLMEQPDIESQYDIKES